MATTSNSEFNNTFIYDLDMSYIYISHMEEGLQYWRLPTAPETVSDTMQSTFSANTALGRSAPVYTFSNAGPRTVQIAIKLHRDLMDDVNMGWSNQTLGFGEDYMENLLHALQAIALPKYNLNNKAIEPPLIGVRLCNTLYVKGVLTSGVGVTYSLPIQENGKYACADLSITISEVDPYDSTTVYKNGSYRGEVGLLKQGATAIGVGEAKKTTKSTWEPSGYGIVDT